MLQRRRRSYEPPLENRFPTDSPPKNLQVVFDERDSIPGLVSDELFGTQRTFPISLREFDDHSNVEAVNAQRMSRRNTGDDPRVQYPPGEYERIMRGERDSIYDDQPINNILNLRASANDDSSYARSVSDDSGDDI